MKICPQCQSTYTDDVDFCSNDGMKLRMKREDVEDPMLGKVLDGRWIIDSKLGEGGMGSVYLGRQRSVNRPVAIKTLRPELVTNDEFVDRFFREAQIATTINHPNCVTILDFGQAGEDNLLFLAMEYLEGMPLADRLEQGPPLTLDEVLTVVDEIAAALEAAHSHGIIHRDLKPDNVFLQKTPNGGMHSKLLDFGIAKDSNASTQFTRTGQIFGTPDYMSPEQCSGADLDGRSDLYSLGCILYEMVCGKPPFENANSMAILMGHVTERPTPPSELAEVPQPVEQLILRLLAKEPDARHADANALRQDLSQVRAEMITRGTSRQPVITSPRVAPGTDAFADTVAGEAIPREPTAQVAVPPARVPTELSYEPPEDPPIKKSKAPLVAAIAAIALLLVAGGALAVTTMMSSDDTPEPPATTKEDTASQALAAPQVDEPPVVEAKKERKTPDAEGLSFEEPAKTVEKTEEEVTPTTEAEAPPKKIVEPASEPKKLSKKERKKQERERKRAEKKQREAEKKRREAEAKKSPASNSIDIPDLKKELPKIEKKIEKKVRTKSDKIVDDLFK